MMRVLCAVLILSMILTCSAWGEDAPADDGTVRHELSAVEATRLMGNGIDLGNTMEACDATRGRYSTDP